MFIQLRSMKAPFSRLCLTALLFFHATSELSPAQQPRDGTGARQPETRPEAVYHGGLVTPPVPKPRFILNDTLGNSFDFFSETDGYITLLFFGYTHCTRVPGQRP